MNRSFKKKQKKVICYGFFFKINKRRISCLLTRKSHLCLTFCKPDFFPTSFPFLPPFPLSPFEPFS